LQQIKIWDYFATGLEMISRDCEMMMANERTHLECSGTTPGVTNRFNGENSLVQQQYLTIERKWMF